MPPDRKNDILMAAGKCFARFGYDKTTLDNIGEMVGMNKASLYYYFKSKEALFYELITREADEFNEMLKKKIEPVTGYKEKIIAWIREGFKYNQNGSILHQLSMETLQKLTPMLDGLKDRAMEQGTDFIAEILKEAGQNKEIKPCNIHEVSSAIQNVIYAVKNEEYMKARPNLGNVVDFNSMINKIVFTVSLMLDGIGIK